MPEDHAAAGVILIQVAYVATRAMMTSRSQLLLTAMSESMVLLQLGSVMMSIAHVSMGGTMKPLKPCCAKPSLPFTVYGIADPFLARY